MKILFLCTAHNSLSQRLYLALIRSHHVSIEYALSDQGMISAVETYQPDLVMCPFLTTMVPQSIYENYLTLIIHPGPPGDVGPSALDWVLMGDNGTVDDHTELLERLSTSDCAAGRTHWGVTVLQAIEDFDAGPVWAFEQFEINIDQPGVTKSELYRGPVTQAALRATMTAISRIQVAAACTASEKSKPVAARYPPTLPANSAFAKLSVKHNLPFQGGKLHHRPLLKAAQRDFDVTKHTAQHISRNIRCGDSQPGAFSMLFGIGLYIYGGLIEDNVDNRSSVTIKNLPNAILGIRNQAVCIATCDGKGVWVTHVRRPKKKGDSALWPKVNAAAGLLELGALQSDDIRRLEWPAPRDWKLSPSQTFQEVWVDVRFDTNQKKTAYLHFDFYNGAMSTQQCSHLIDAMDYIIHQSDADVPVQAVVLMGGSYFSNGIALNVIEAVADPALESWLNINRIDDVVQYLLQEFPKRNIVTVAAIRGNAAAGGVALAAACDVVIASNGVVLNPAYRAVGLFGSEYHTLSYYGRCGETNGTKILRSMTPISASQAQSIGLVDYVFPGTGSELDDYIRTHVEYLLSPGILKQGAWKRRVDLSPSSLAAARAYELGEMSKDFWSPRSSRYHTRRFDFVRKVKPIATPLRFAVHRRVESPSRLDEEETDDFDSIEYFREQNIINLKKKFAIEIGRALPGNDSCETLVSDSSMPSPPERNIPCEPPTPVSDEKFNGQTLFKCYYEPPIDHASSLTPPETPTTPKMGLGLELAPSALLGA